jgi:hypothetical protein
VTHICTYIYSRNGRQEQNATVAAPRLACATAASRSRRYNHHHQQQQQQRGYSRGVATASTTSRRNNPLPLRAQLTQNAPRSTDLAPTGQLLRRHAARLADRADPGQGRPRLRHRDHRPAERRPLAGIEEARTLVLLRRAIIMTRTEAVTEIPLRFYSFHLRF